MNPTVTAILNRLDKKPLHVAQEIADVFGVQAQNTVVNDIKNGRLAAVKFGGRYLIADAEARRYIAATGVIPTEGTLPNE
ncbi:MAG: helix-turn-helix domain-containing protein [Kiritimatiellae bacterium]|nr:helix-turn-helix domain-containing protein [Kiritimatiellia bacterium]